MIISFKYHIASLMAVFLALGIGILIGTAMLGSDTLVEQQRQLTDRLEMQIENLQKKNEVVNTAANMLEVNNNMQNQFSRQVMPLIIGGRLAGRQVAVLETGGYSNSREVIQTLKDSGAQVQSVIKVVNWLDVKNKKILLESINRANMADAELSALLAGELGRGLIYGDSKIFNQLQELNLLKVTGTPGKISGGSGSRSVNSIIILGGSMDSSNNLLTYLDLPLVDYFKGQNIPVYGVEEIGAAQSYMREYQRKKICTVDNVDTIPGQVALVLAMAGQYGHYGIKGTAEKLLPNIYETGLPAFEIRKGVGANTGS